MEMLCFKTKDFIHIDKKHKSTQWMAVDYLNQWWPSPLRHIYVARPNYFLLWHFTIQVYFECQNAMKVYLYDTMMYIRAIHRHVVIAVHYVSQ